MGKFKKYLESIDTSVSVNASQAGYESGEHGNALESSDWYAKGDARIPKLTQKEMLRRKKRKQLKEQEAIEEVFNKKERTGERKLVFSKTSSMRGKFDIDFNQKIYRVLLSKDFQKDRGIEEYEKGWFKKIEAVSGCDVKVDVYVTDGYAEIEAEKINC